MLPLPVKFRFSSDWPDRLKLTELRTRSVPWPEVSVTVSPALGAAGEKVASTSDGMTVTVTSSLSPSPVSVKVVVPRARPSTWSRTSVLAALAVSEPSGA